MNRRELDRLIERYYNGESTEEEDQALRKLFRSDDVPDGYDAEKVVFGYYESAGVIPEPSLNFESGILAGIDTAEIAVRKHRTRKFFLPWLSAAATVLILFGSWFFLIQRSETEDTFSDPEIAYAETMKILMDVSSKLNRGAMALEPIRKIDQMASQSIRTVTRSTGKITKNLGDLGTVLEPLENPANRINENIK